MARITPRQRYGEKIRLQIFGDEYHGTRSPTWLSEKTGVSVNTIKKWKQDPGRMPAYRYLQIMNIVKGD